MSKQQVSLDTSVATPTAAHRGSQNEDTTPRPKRLNFSNPQLRVQHVDAFRTWLPAVLHNAPDIDWDRLPSSVMGHLMRQTAASPDATVVALAVGCAAGAVKETSLFDYCHKTIQLFRLLRARYGMSDLAQLQPRQFWDHFVSGRTLSVNEVKMLEKYDILAAHHERAYVERLNERQRLALAPYLLPPLPTGFMDKQGLRRIAITTGQQRRKEQSDVLVPLFPLLAEIAQLRKQAAERFIKAFRSQRDRVLAGEVALPYRFQYTDRVFDITKDAATPADVTLLEREVTLSLTLWDRVNWAQKHPEHYEHNAYQIKMRIGAYAPTHTMYFLQYEGPPGDLLWCGDLLAQGLIGKQGVKRGFNVSRPELLSPKSGDSHWLSFARRAGDILFEPESLYRGALYAAALATLALTNGSRVSELLQVSANRFETIVVDELKNQQPTGRKIGILVQRLLPKGYNRESDRQFFLMSEMAGRLLTEIGHLLEATHGGSIPIVQPYKSGKSEDLAPEPYLFQWHADCDGRLGLLNVVDVCALLRFLYYGLSLTTRTGKPIYIATHLLRHVLATHARTVQNIPAEAVAYLLHHRVTFSPSAQTLSIPEATAYYSRLPQEQLLALLFEAQSILASQQNPSYLQAPTPRTLEVMDAALREIFEQWSTIGPTVLGYCGAGLCIRPDNRALCLGCRYLVPHYNNLSKAKTWRKLYVLQAQLHDAHGHHIDAQQARRMIQYLDDIITLMQIQIRTRQDGGYLPFADTLPPPQDEEGDER